MITLDKLKSKRNLIHQIAQHYHAENIRVFGSVARGEATKNSDIDILVNFLPNASLFDQAGMINKLGELFNCKVDVVSERALNPNILDQILNESIPI